MKQIHRFLLVPLQFSLGLCLTMGGCGHDHDDHPGGHGPHSDHGNTYNAHACDHLAFGPNHNVTPGADHGAAGSAEVMTRSIVVFRAADAGYIKFSWHGAGTYAVFTDRDDVTVALEDSDGNVISPTAAANKIDACTEIKSKAVYDLQSEGDHFLKLEPAQASVTVNIVIVEPGAGRTDD